MSISFAATPQAKEGQQTRAYIADASAGAPPSRRTGYDRPYVDRDHWNKVFTQPEYFDGIAKQEGMIEGAKVSLHGDDYVYRQAMMGYLSATRNVPLDDMRSIFDSEKDGFAQKVLGKKTATARELFDWHKTKFERENEKSDAARTVIEDVTRNSLQDAMMGGDTPFVESVTKSIAATGDMFTEEEKSRLWEKAEEQDKKIRASQAKFAPEARFLFSALGQTTGQQAGMGAPDMREMAGKFAQLPDNQRKAIYELVGGFAQLQQTDKGFWYQLAESLGRGASDIVERVPRNFREQTLRGQLRLLESDQPVFRATGVAGAEFSAAGNEPVFGATQGQMVTPEEREQAKAKIQSDLGVLKVEREIRDLAERVVDPIKTVSFLPEIVEEGLYGAARSLPYTAAAAIPFAGIPAVAAALFSSNYDRIMLEYPDLDPDKAALIAAISAPIEAGLERMKVNTITGRLPVFGGLVKRLQHPNQRNITRIAIGGAGIVAEQNVQEIVQNATFPFIQTVAAALDQDMPDYDWAKRIEGMPRELAVQFVALLPLSLMGVGALSHREMTRGADYIRNKTNLEKAGYGEGQIDRITGAATADEAQTILQEESGKRDPEAVKAAAQRVLDEVLALREQKAPASLPRLEKQGADYVVLSPEGRQMARSTDQTVAEQALVSARRETVQREMRDVHTGINEAVEFIQKVNEARQRGEDIAEVIRESAPRTLLSDYEANPTQENLDRLFETVRAFGQDINEPAELANFPVIGSNQGALAEGVWRSVIRINEGADGTIVMREFAQDNLKRAISEGRTTMDFVRQQLNDVLPQIDSNRIKRQLRTETDTDVIEAFSDVALAYFRGSIREEQIPAGLRGIMRRLAIISRDIFRRAYNLARLRAEGKLDRDFEALLAEAVGVDQQALVDRARERTEQEVAPEVANYSIGVTPQQDSDYLAAVERDDMETAQRMVDDAARAAGYTLSTWRGDVEAWDDFVRRREVGIFTSQDKQFADEYGSMRGGVTRRFYVKTNSVLDLANPNNSEMQWIKEWGEAWQEDGWTDRTSGDDITAYDAVMSGRLFDYEGDWSGERWRDLQLAAKNAGFDLLIVPDAATDIEDPTATIVLDERNIKLADPVTRDSQGNVIPLSQRFDATTADINYSIVRSVDHYRNDTRFDKLVEDGRVVTGVDVNDFTDMHILLHSPDNAFAGTIQLTDGGQIDGKGGVYYPALYADKNYFWASTEAMIMRTAAHLNEIGAKNNGRVLMGLVSAPVEKLFSSTSMATGVVKFLNALTKDERAGLSKDDLNAMIIAASKVQVVKKTKGKPPVVKTFKTTLKDGATYAKTIGKIDALLDPDNSVFQVRKAFVESLANQVSKHLNANKANAKYVAGILADAENKHAKKSIKRGTLSKASFLQGLGNMLTEPFLRDFQEHGNGKIYAIVEVQGEVKGIATTEHESYPATIVPVNKKSKVKLHVLKEAVDWQRVVGKDTGKYTTKKERLKLLPTSGMSSTSLKVLGVKAGSSANVLNYSIASGGEMRDSATVVPAGVTNIDTTRSLPPNTALVQLVNNDGEVAAVVGAPYDGTPEGLVSAHQQLEEAIGKTYQWRRQYTKSMSQRGGTDATGAPAWVVSANLKQVARVGTPQARYILGDLSAEEAAQVDIPQNAPLLLSDASNQDPQTMSADAINKELDTYYFADSLTDEQAIRERLLKEEVVARAGDIGRLPPFAEYGPRKTLNYSISTQSEIDRVQAAMDRMSRSPSERISQYAALKERLTAALERNKPIMQSMRGDTLPQDFDRTRILNDLGFLDYILKVLPPEVRGRVGGYTNLASIAPVDVYKGDQKVSEAKNPAGAIISAWMREGQNIGQAQKNTALPEGYSTVANTTDERRDKTVANFLIDRLKKIDRELERYYKRDLMERIFDVLDKSRPKAGQSGVKRSTLGAETQRFADMVYRSSLLDDEKTAERLAAIEAQITSTEATADSQKRISDLSEEWTIVNTFGDLKSRPSETLAYGLEWLQGQLKAGREAWQIKEAARIQENRERAAKVVAFLGKPTDVGRFENKSTLQRFLQTVSAYDLDHKSFEQFAPYLFGDEVAAELSKKMQRAQIDEAKAELNNTRLILAALREGAKTAGMSTGKALVAFKENQSNAVRKLEGRKVKDTKISIELAKKIVRGLADRGSLSNQDVQTLADELAALPRDSKKEFVTIKQVIFRGEEVRLTMSRAQAMQLWLTWQQTDAQEKMRADGFTDDSFDDLDNLISGPFAQAILRVTSRIYGSGYALTNPIYARMFGMNMPMVRNYAPARYLSSKEVKDVGLDGSALTSGGQPSFAKSRVNHTAKLDPADALTVLQSHIAMQSHWVAFAEVTREYRSLLSNPDVRESIKQRLGADVLRTADMWGDQMEQRGGNKGREIAWINNMLGAVIGGQSVSLLGYNLKSLMMQTDNLMRFTLALDSRQIGSALSDPVALMQSIRKVWKTDIIQTRLEGGATAETRFFFERFVSMFRRGAKVAEMSMMPMNYLDSAGLSISGAIVYQAEYKDALDSGMDPTSAEKAAKDAVEAMVYRYGQPVLMGQKSNIENSGNAFTKAFFLFMSDPRLKMAIISDSVRGLATGRGDWKAHVRRIVAIEMMAVVSHVLATAFRDATSDDDDEDLWSMGGFARALLLAPFQGYFLLGSVSDLVLSRLTEAQWFTPTQNPLIRTADTAFRAFNNLDDAFNFDDPDALVKEWTNITRSIAVTPPLAAPAVIMNLVRPLVQAWENMDEDE